MASESAFQDRDLQPKGIKDLVVLVTSYSKRNYDITAEVSSIDIFESIFSPVIHGEMRVVDRSGMLSVMPHIGQEFVTIKWQRDRRDIERTYRIIDVTQIEQINDYTGTYLLRFVSLNQFKNAAALFSKSYFNYPHVIIEELYKEHFDVEIDIRSVSKIEHNVVFPWIKPYQAMHMLLKNTLSLDNTPMFTFEQFYQEPQVPLLISYGEMFAQQPITRLQPKAMYARSAAQEKRKLYDIRGSIERYEAPFAFQTLEQLAQGAFGATGTLYDISEKTREKLEFNFREKAPHNANEWVSEFFSVNDLPVHLNYNTVNMPLMKNTKAFQNEFPNLSTTDDFDRMILNSWKRRIRTVQVDIYMDSIAYVLGSGEAFTVGKTVEYVMPVFSPKTEQQLRQDFKNRMMSGKYIISDIRHNIKEYVYTMSVSLIRDGMGEETTLEGVAPPVYDLVANRNFSIDQAVSEVYSD